MALLHTLHRLPGTNSKSFVLTCMRVWHLLALTQEDEVPYPSTKEKGGGEPRWQTTIAWRRFDCVQEKWMADSDRDQWRISPIGERAYSILCEAFQKGELPVCAGFLWSADFKKILCSDYIPSDKDTKRPPSSIYKDMKSSWGPEDLALLEVLRQRIRPNQAPEPTPTTVTPPAGQEARQP